MTTRFKDGDNPFCQECQEDDCLVSMEGTCEMIRVYLKAKKAEAERGEK